jgi:hypothetical protein
MLIAGEDAAARASALLESQGYAVDVSQLDES